MDIEKYVDACLATQVTVDAACFLSGLCLAGGYRFLLQTQYSTAVARWGKGPNSKSEDSMYWKHLYGEV